ncbi:hypothetical protein [Alteromonas sp. M12]|uniref:hypothetical protein n=1 Tax=Alteromonas sp. M12 TaxID=3135644 RepID=UPI00319E1DCA
MTSSSKHSPNKLAKISKLACIAFLSFLLILACQFFISSVLIVKPEQTISLWENKKKPVDAAQALTIIYRLERAERLAFLPLRLRDSTKINELYSRLYLTLALLEHPESNLISAEHYALLLTQEAPSDYLGWTLLAQSKVNNENYNWEDQSALTKTLTLGPFERTNQIRLVPLLIENWATLSLKNKALASNMLHAALNELHMSRLAAMNMRKFGNIEPFRRLIANSRYNDRIQRVLLQ